MRVQKCHQPDLYAFGKMGDDQGVRVDKSFEQLNTLFTDIMKEMQVEPEYTPSYLRFYRSGMRITYEDVIQTAQEEEQTQPEDEGNERGRTLAQGRSKRAGGARPGGHHEVASGERAGSGIIFTSWVSLPGMLRQAAYGGLSGWKGI